MRQISFDRSENNITSFKSNIESLESKFQAQQHEELKRYKNYFDNEKRLKKELASINEQRLEIIKSIESWECYGKVIITSSPLFSNSSEEIVKRFSEIGNMLFENEYTDILNKFIDEKILFNSMISILVKVPEELLILNIYEDMDQTQVFKSIIINLVDFIQTGMTIESCDHKYEIFKLVVFNEDQNLREVYLIGFIQYQIPKWRKMLNIQRKIVYYDKTFEYFMKSYYLKSSKLHSDSLQKEKYKADKLIDLIKPESKDEAEESVFSPDTKRKFDKLIQIRDAIEDKEMESAQILHSVSRSTWIKNKIQTDTLESERKYNSDDEDSSISFGEMQKSANSKSKLNQDVFKDF